MVILEINLYHQPIGSKNIFIFRDVGYFIQSTENNHSIYTSNVESDLKSMTLFQKYLKRLNLSVDTTSIWNDLNMTT